MMTEQEERELLKKLHESYGFTIDENGDVVEMEDPAPEGYITIH